MAVAEAQAAAVEAEVAPVVSFEASKPDDENVPPTEDTDAVPEREQSRMSARDKENVETTRFGFLGYFLLCFFSCGIVAAACVYFWSLLGCQQDCLNAVQKLDVQGKACFAAVFFVAGVLYQLDFYWPDKEDGDPRGGGYCLLYQGDPRYGICVVVMLGLTCMAGFYMFAETYVWAPVVLTSFLSPLVLCGIRLATKPPAHLFDGDEPEDPSDIDFSDKMCMLKRKVFLENDEKNFYKAASIALSLVSVGCLGAWIAEGDIKSDLDKVQATTSDLEQEELFILWVAPGVAALINLLIAVLLCLRLVCANIYTGTDKFRNKLLAGGLDAETAPEREGEINAKKSVLLKARITKLGTAGSRNSFLLMGKDKQEQYIAMHTKYEKMISFIIQCVGCFILVLLGCNMIAFQLATTHASIIQMFFAIVWFIFITFVLFIFTSFRRIWRAMGTALLDMPIFKSAKNAIRSDWFRAVCLLWLGPLSPMFFFVSMVNELIRKCRLPNRTPAEVEGAETSDGQKKTSSCSSLLTLRVRKFLADAATWDKISILKKTYILAGCVVIYVLTPIGLNVLLSWMIDLLGGCSFFIILAAVWATGLVLFLLPPVPGAPVYLFGGVLVSGKGVQEWGDPEGFWMGSFICIGVCFVLKLSACAMQQKGIGELLGSNQWVRQTVGVHKPFIRAIEAILRKPGLSFGKVVILVGGPDWPTSVLAGVLRLSLVQCLIGTMPIITYISPLSLTGSFYYKRAESETWQNLGDLMFTLTGIMTIVYWALIGWAVQNTYERDYEELSRPMEKYVDLEWLDHRQEEIARMVVVSWEDVPCFIKFLFIAGCIGEVLCAQAFYWGSSSCFGEFQVTDDINTLSVYGKDESVIKFYGLVGLGVSLVGFIGLVAFDCWRKSRIKGPLAEATIAVDKEEESWKQQRIDEARKWVPSDGEGDAQKFEEAGKTQDQDEAPSATSQKPIPSLPQAEANASATSRGSKSQDWQPTGSWGAGDKPAEDQDKIKRPRRSSAPGLVVNIAPGEGDGAETPAGRTPSEPENQARSDRQEAIAEDAGSMSGTDKGAAVEENVSEGQAAKPKKKIKRRSREAPKGKGASEVERKDPDDEEADSNKPQGKGKGKARTTGKKEKKAEDEIVEDGSNETEQVATTDSKTSSPATGSARPKRKPRPQKASSPAAEAPPAEAEAEVQEE